MVFLLFSILLECALGELFSVFMHVDLANCSIPATILYPKENSPPTSSSTDISLMAKQGPRKKLPKELAVITADNCTGCEACIEVCPVDCILKVQQYDHFHNLQSWCEIDIERCVGCEVCVHIPGKKSNPHELKVCPWDAIEMIPTEEVAQVVAQIGGPPEYVEQNWDRLVGTAQHLAELKAQAG